MDGWQSVIYLRFTYHCCRAVIIPVLVSLHLLVDLLQCSSPVVCMLHFNHWHTLFLWANCSSSHLLMSDELWKLSRAKSLLIHVIEAWCCHRCVDVTGWDADKKHNRFLLAAWRCHLYYWSPPCHFLFSTIDRSTWNLVNDQKKLPEIKMEMGACLIASC